jgi:hypothetical protein
MTSQTFNFPGTFFREIDLTQQTQEPVGTPAGIVGTSERGPAFVPSIVGSFADFTAKFGNLNPRFMGPYAAEKHLANKTALTFVRVLGAGGNTTAQDVEDFRSKGVVKNAGFKISSSLTSDNLHGGAHGSVQLLLAKHAVTASEAYSQLGFSNNDSLFVTSSQEAFLVRGVIFVASGARLQVMSHNENWSTSIDDAATVNGTTGYFKLVISSSAGSTYSSDEGNAGIRILTASLDPSDTNYFAKILNTDPEKFSTEKYVVYTDYAVDSEIASVSTNTDSIVIASGSSNTSSTSGDTGLPFQNVFGRFDTRYKAPRTPSFISQPFGTNEYDLFHVESLDDGVYANSKVKISISNIKKSANPKYKFGTFSLIVRAFDDIDTSMRILEQFNNLSLDPESDSYVARVIGDRKVTYNFDSEIDEDRRIIVSGKFGNKSKYIRVIMNEQVEKGLIPEESLPFGFRGLEVLNTNSRLQDNTGSVAASFSGIKRLSANVGSSANYHILGSVVPPMPYRFKVTRGAVSASSTGLLGSPGGFEITDPRYFWGVKLERNKNTLNPNPYSEISNLAYAYTKFNGIEQLDAVVTGSSNKDTFHNHKFTLARVALGNTSLSDLTSSAEIHMKEAAYIRNGKPDVTNYKIVDDNTSAERITLATLLNKGSSASTFNAYSQYAKFTTILQGGFDGVNILDKNAAIMNDRASSTDGRDDGIYGNVNSSFTSPGFSFNQNGTGVTNNTINSYRVAANIITDPIASNINVLAVPGQREPLVTDYFADKARDFGMAFYVMDVPYYESDGNRVFDGLSNVHVDPNETADQFETRTVDNYYCGAYMPDITMDDTTNNRRVTVPASIAAVSALSFNDKAAFPWFAPAGFNRASLQYVTNTSTRINQSERERLYDVHLNPIIKFPREGYVIFSQNTLEQAGSALGSVNVVRMLNDVKRQVIDVGNKLIFENMSDSLREEFVNQITPILSTIQLRKGIESFKVICDNTNNTDADKNANKMNCQIILKPTRAVEFIALDFIISNSGATFVS